jgi:hypothetical protein
MLLSAIVKILQPRKYGTLQKQKEIEEVAESTPDPGIYGKFIYPFLPCFFLFSLVSGFINSFF